MSPQSWQQVKSLLEACLDEPARQASLLEEAEPEVRAEVQSLLDAHLESTQFLNQSPIPAMALAEAFERDAMVGQMVGSYRLVREIGRGVSGVVYVADRADEEFDRVVAVKILSRGMDTRFIVQRFRSERQILAGLDHRFIARLLDGGTTPSGLPYIVMEYVEGLPLSIYCDRINLTIAERIQLFRNICDAVSYAHNHLIVHRDLKPGNVLVTPDGTPKLLDFGIARLLNHADEEPEYLRMATPAYASPEQIRGGLVGVASDLYSLGVILYELLTGHAPYHLPAEVGHDLTQIICERAPTQPSLVASYREDEADPNEIARSRSTQPKQLARELRGELDSILLRALEKDPADRYTSVTDFSGDLRRYLENLPVRAHSRTAGYRVRKFFRRHRIAVTLSAFAILALFVTTITAVREAQRLSARIEADHKLASSFLIDIHDSIAKLQGATPAREALLQQSVHYLNGLASDAGDDPGLRRSLALSYERFADLQAGTAGPGLGKSAMALNTSLRAQAIWESLARDKPNDLGLRRELAVNYLLISYITGRNGNFQQRLEYDRKALAIAEDLTRAQPLNQEYQSTLARAHTSLGYGLMLLDRSDEAQSHLTNALQIYTRLSRENPSDPARTKELAYIHYRIGSSNAQAGEPALALDHLRNALELQEVVAAREPRNQVIRSDIAGTHHFLGVVLGKLGRNEEALEHLNDAVRIRTAALAGDPRDARSASLLAGNHDERSRIHLLMSQKSEALQDSRKAVSLLAAALAVDEGSFPLRIALAGANARLGDVYVLFAETAREDAARQRHWQEAASTYSQANRLYSELRRNNHLPSFHVGEAERVAREEDRCRRKAERS